MLRHALLVLALLSVCAPVRADGPGQAGLAVQFEDGRLVTRCIELEGADQTGADLLSASGLELVVDSSTGMGISVCQIEGVGCAYPAERCFCRCMGGGECRYWNYYYREPGQDEWTYSPLGAVLRRVQPGSVEAWVWADGHTPPAQSLTFESICPPATPTPAPAEPTPAPPTPTPAVASVAHPTAAEPPPPIDTPAPPPTAAQAGAARGLRPYWPVVLTLAAVAAIALIRRLRAG